MGHPQKAANILEKNRKEKFNKKNAEMDQETMDSWDFIVDNLDWLPDYIKTENELTWALWSLMLWMTRNVNSPEQLWLIFSEMWINTFTKDELNNLHNLITKWDIDGKAILSRSEGKVFQSLIVKAMANLNNTLASNGGIDWLIGKKSLEVIWIFASSIANNTPKLKFLIPVSLLKPLPTEEIDSHLEKIKTDEVREVVFPDTSKWSPFEWRINITKHNFDQAENENQTTAEHNLGIANQVANRTYDSDKAFDIAFNHNNWESWIAVQVNSEWFLNEVKNKKDNIILKNEFNKIMENSINFVNKYINDNQMNEWEELDFELRPKIHTEKDPIKFKVKREWYKINVYLNDNETPVSSRLRKWSAKINAQFWFWANWTPSESRTFENAKYTWWNLDLTRPITNQVALKTWIDWGYADARDEINTKRDGWWFTMRNWVEIINKDNTLKTNFAMTWILDKYSKYNRNHMIFGWEASVEFNPNKKLNLYGAASRNQVQWVSGELKAKYKINDNRSTNAGASYNKWVNNLQWALVSQNMASFSAGIENKNMALNIVTWKTLYNLSSKPYVWATATLKFGR